MKRLLLLWLLAVGEAHAMLPGVSDFDAPISLTLTQAEVIAAQNRPRIGEAQFEADAAQQKVREARADFYPQITANAAAVGAGDGGETRIAASGGLNNPTVFSRQSDGLAATQLLTDFGRTSALTDGARFSAHAASADAESVREQVRLEVDRAYYEALRAQTILQVATQTVAARKLFLDQISALAQGQLKSELDVSFARVNFGEANLLLLRARNGVEQASAALGAALGYREKKEFILSEEKIPPAPPGDLSSLIAQALQARPDAVALRNRYEAAVKEAAAAQDAKYPSIQAIGDAGVSPVRDDAQLNQSYIAAGISIALPVANGGRLSAQTEEARLQASAAERDLNEAEDDIVRVVRVAWLNVSTAFQAIDVTNEVLASATESSDLAQARYRAGISSIVEASQAQLNQTEAQLQSANAKYDYEILLSSLRYQLGDLAGSAPSHD